MGEQSAAAEADKPLTIDFDPVEATVEEAYKLYDKVRGKCPVAHSDAHGGYYLLTRHADVLRAALDWKTFSSARGVSLPPGSVGGMVLPAIGQDPPEQTAWRKLYLDAVSPAALEAMEPHVAAIADQLIDGFAARGECDLVHDYAEVLPVLGVCSVIGFTDRPPEEIRALAVDLQAGVADKALEARAMERFSQMVLAEVLGRRANPKDDYLTRIALAEIDGRQMNESEIVLFMIGLLVAGHESTTSALSGLLFHVLSRPDLKDRVLHDDAALAAAIEEAVRIVSPFHGFCRTATEETQVAGVSIPQDGYVRLCWAAANRDPAVYEHPAEFDIDRPANPHLGFGAGRHTCAGAPFARLEMRVALRRLLARLPDVAVTQPQLEWRVLGGMLTVPERLQASFSPRAG